MPCALNIKNINAATPPTSSAILTKRQKISQKVGNPFAAFDLNKLSSQFQNQRQKRVHHEILLPAHRHTSEALALDANQRFPWKD